MLISIFLLLLILGLSIPKSSLANKIFRLVFSIWMIVLCFSVINFSKLYDVNLRVYIYFIIAVSFYFLGFFIIRYKNVGSEYSVDEIIENAYILSKRRFFHFLSIFTACLCLYYSIRFFNVISNLDDIGDVRRARFEVGGLFTSGYSVIVYNYIVTPLVWFYKFLFVFSLIFGIKKYYSFFVYGLVICLSFYFVGGGRNIVVEILFMYMSMNIIANKKFTIFVLLKNIILFLFLIILFFVGTYMRLSRAEISLSLFIEIANTSFQQILTYVTGSFRAFDYAISNYDYLSYGFGIYTFSGLEEIVANFLNLIGFNFEPHSYYWGEIIRKPIFIGYGSEFNALYTGLFPFYFDFGLFGIVVYSALLGFLSRKYLNVLIYRKSLSALFLSICFLQISIFLFMTFKLNASLFIAMSISAFLLQRKK